MDRTQMEVEMANAKWIGETFMRYQLMEECAELIKAISKYNRSIGIGQPTPITTDEAYHNMVAEIADVVICVEQLCYLMGIEEDEVNAFRMAAVSKVAQRRLENE